jgi:hypothetical protein
MLALVAFATITASEVLAQETIVPGSMRVIEDTGAPGAYAQAAAPTYGAPQYAMPGYTWHAGYYHTSWGRPLALVVPPTATYQTDYSWGVSGTRITPINPQFTGPYAGYPYEGGNGGFLPTPHWPSDTNQFGVYYIRGPW